MAQNQHAIVHGTTLYHGTVGAAAATPLAGIDAIESLPQASPEWIDITRVDQASRFKQYALGMIDPGELTVTLGFDKAQIDTLYGLAYVAKSWRIEFSEGSSLSFEGVMTPPVIVGGSTSDEVTVRITVRVSGEVTFDAAA